MMMKRRCRQAAMLGIGLMLASTVAEAQWVLVARRAIGRVEQMSQSTPGSSATLDTSAVIIDAPADKVYATFVRKIRAVPDVTVAKEDEAAQTMQFANGVNTASIKVNVLGDGLAHVMVSATNNGPPPAPMTTIVDRILAVCQELNVECQRGQP